MTRTVTVIFTAVVCAATVAADAAVLCARRRSDGTPNGLVSVRAACTGREIALDPVALGLQGPAGADGAPGPAGPPGPEGPAGPGLASLDGVPCDTGTPDLPEGRTLSSVDDGGTLTLRCLSTTTNPLLAVGLAAGPRVCTGDIIPVCILARFTVREIDATGTPVPDGFACISAANQSPFTQFCESRRFAPGTIVRLRATDGSGFAPTWSGCDAVAGDTCTVTVASDRLVSVLPE